MDDDPFGVFWGMENQSVPETIHVDRSTPGPSRVFADHDGFTTWPGPDPPASTSGRSNHGSLGVLSKTPADPSACKSVSKSPLLLFRFR